MSGSDADIVWRGPTPHATRFDDLYYSADDPIGEVRHTFLDGVDFAALCRRPHVTIGETGFGTGLNFLLASSAFLETAAPNATLDFVSVEAFPMARDDLDRAHGPFPSLASLAEPLRAAWPGAVPGVHRLSFMNGRVRLILLIGDARSMLSTMRFQADAWFLDGFAPAKNPEMWEPTILREVARLSRPGATVASFTAAGAVRRGLDAVGFDIEKRSGFGRKRDCLAGTRRADSMRDVAPPWAGQPWTVPPSPLSSGARVAVIGDGIAGRATVRALGASGFKVVHIGGGDTAADSSASLPRALIAPKLTRGDQPFPVFWRQAFLDAVRVLDGIDANDPVWVGERGLRIPSKPGQADDAQARLVEELAWPASILSHDSEEGLSVGSAGAVDTTALFNALAPRPRLRVDIAALSRRDATWCLEVTDGATILEADAVIIAGGMGSARLLEPFGRFGLRAGLGRAAVMRSDKPVGRAVLRDGYRTAPDADGIFMAGATAESLRPGASPLSEEDGIAALRARLAPLIEGLDAEMIRVWRGTRCDTGDHLPLAGPIQDWDAFNGAYDGLRHGKPVDDMSPARHLPGLFVLSGLGARGFQAAFLLADHLATMMTGRVSPLAATIDAAIAPARFQVRDLRRNVQDIDAGENGVAEGT